MRKTFLPILALSVLMILLSPKDLSLASNINESKASNNLSKPQSLIFGYSEEVKKTEPLPKNQINYSYVAGYPGGEFRPDDEITRAEIASIFEGLLVGQTFYDKNEIHFLDVKEEDWFYRSVTFMTKQGYMSGYPEGYFEPNMPITRAELVTVLSRYQNATGSKGGTVQFSDIEPDHWAYNDLLMASELGWLKGYADKQFRPNASITRAEAVTLINRVLDRKPDSENIEKNQNEMKKFSDELNHWAHLDICEAANTHEYYLDSDNNEVWTRILNY
ncbi:MAG: S-layer homology domain-containing protein [Tissierellia bacterium]|nr:S-layer homology domain-containing protein [Tissierellia bacterium]